MQEECYLKAFALRRKQLGLKPVGDKPAPGLQMYDAWTGFEASRRTLKRQYLYEQNNVDTVQLDGKGTSSTICV